MSRETRDDPYKNFKFAVALVAVGAIALRIGRKLFARAELVHPGRYVEELPTGTRPMRALARPWPGRWIESWVDPRGGLVELWQGAELALPSKFND